MSRKLSLFLTLVFVVVIFEGACSSGMKTKRALTPRARATFMVCPDSNIRGTYRPHQLWVKNLLMRQRARATYMHCPDSNNRGASRSHWLWVGNLLMGQMLP